MFLYYDIDVDAQGNWYNIIMQRLMPVNWGGLNGPMNEHWLS